MIQGSAAPGWNGLVNAVEVRALQYGEQGPTEVPEGGGGGVEEWSGRARSRALSSPVTAVTSGARSAGTVGARSGARRVLPSTEYIRSSTWNACSTWAVVPTAVTNARLRG